MVLTLYLSFLNQTQSETLFVCARTANDFTRNIMYPLDTHVSEELKFRRKHS